MKYGAVKILSLLPMLPAVSLMPNRMSGYESDEISVRNDFAAPFFDFTSTGMSASRDRTKKSSSRVEFSLL